MINRETILSLLNRAKNPSISIYLPTHVKGEEVQQDPIRLKNALKNVEKQLYAHEIKASKVEKMLEKPRELLDQPLFWQHNDKGLAIFITDDDFEYYRLPLDFKERVMVEDHFLITPLLPMMALEGTYCVLAISQKNIRLLRCTREKTNSVALENAPDSVDEFLKYDVDDEKHIQLHAGQGSDGGAIFHGQGSSGEANTRQIINYLKAVENEVTSFLRKRNDPLILIGVEKAVAEYRKLNHYNRLMDEAITENPDPLNDETINEKAWGIIKSHFLQDMYDDMKQFADLSGSNKRSDNLSQVVEASYYGKVDSLFVPIGLQSWGRFDEDRDTIHHSPEQQNGDHDLLNMAAIKTLKQGGNVYALGRDDMPENATIAAVFRYG
jgi:hypothetical protein